MTNEPLAINMSVMVKGTDRYIFVYDDSQAVAAMRVADRWAADPGLSFTEMDADQMSQRIRSMALENGEDRT